MSNTKTDPNLYIPKWDSCLCLDYTMIVIAMAIALYCNCGDTFDRPNYHINHQYRCTGSVVASENHSRHTRNLDRRGQ